MIPIRFSPTCGELLRIVKGVPQEIVGILSSTPRFLLMPELKEHTAQWQCMVEKGKIAATTDLLHSRINMPSYHVRIYLKYVHFHFRLNR